MAKLKQNKTIARFIVAGGTLLAGLGIWTSIINQSAAYQPAAAPAAIASEPNTNADVAVITVTEIPTAITTAPVSTPLPTGTQTIPAPVTPPVQTTVVTTPAVTTPPPTKPAVTTTMMPPPVVKPPVTTPPPVITTRGS
jgi:hypothetical protein